MDCSLESPLANGLVGWNKSTRQTPSCTTRQLGGRGVLRGASEAASRRKARTRGFAPPALAGFALVDGATLIHIRRRQSGVKFTVLASARTRNLIGGVPNGVPQHAAPIRCGVYRMGPWCLMNQIVSTDASASKVRCPAIGRGASGVTADQLSKVRGVINRRWTTVQRLLVVRETLVAARRQRISARPLLAPREPHQLSLPFVPEGEPDAPEAFPQRQRGDPLQFGDRVEHVLQPVIRDAGV